MIATKLLVIKGKLLEVVIKIMVPEGALPHPKRPSYR